MSDTKPWPPAMPLAFYPANLSQGGLSELELLGQLTKRRSPKLSEWILAFVVTEATRRCSVYDDSDRPIEVEIPSVRFWEWSGNELAGALSAITLHLARSNFIDPGAIELIRKLQDVVVACAASRLKRYDEILANG